MKALRILRFITRRRLSWVAAIAASLIAALFVATLWISPAFFSEDNTHMFWLRADRGRVDTTMIVGNPFDTGDSNMGTLIEKITPIGFDLWFHFDTTPFLFSRTPHRRYVMIVPLWFPFVLCALPAIYLWRTDRAEPWQCASCRYDLRGLDTDLCPECGKQSERAS